MKSGRESGLYVPFWAVSTLGATQPSPLSISTAFSVSWFSSKYEKPK